ncbi:arginine vasopressin-induced protein 1 [Emys orbicularis]|uniref:arginine vasopressin-induced protein 1 n=1 Tax=Emys orbicularis TaxID=82168 RepID=UPI0031FC7094
MSLYKLGSKRKIFGNQLQDTAPRSELPDLNTQPVTLGRNWSSPDDLILTGQQEKFICGIGSEPRGRPMGTPASVACDPLQCQGPEARARKRASANIFQDVGLLQLRRLFRSSGDERAEERAQLIWEYAGDRRTAQALRQLRSGQRRQWHPPQLSPAAQDSSDPRLEECSSPSADPGSSTRLEEPSRDRQRPGPRRKGPRTRRRKRGPGPTGYLHQLQQ